MKVVTVVGARPQFIKVAAVSRVLRGRHGVREILIHTGQHYDINMSEIFFQQMGIPNPDYSLDIGSGSHGAQTGRMLEAVEAVIQEEKPDWMLVYGDTNSTLAGALAAAKVHIPVAHVEAGLRSFNHRMPEEINRVLTDHISSMLFAPTSTAVANLLSEGIAPGSIHQVGDVMYDAVKVFGALADSTSEKLSQLEVERGAYVLATIHRAENTDDPERLTAIIRGLGITAQYMPVIMPLHPRTRDLLRKYGLLEGAADEIRLIDPVGYLDMILLEKHAKLIVTDSGGVQKEAFFHQVQCLTLRDETEWLELVDLGWNRLASPASAGNVAAAIMAALTAPPGLVACPYGKGDSAELIVSELLGDHQ